MDDKEKTEAQRVARRNADRREENDPRYTGPERRVAERRSTR